MLKARKIVGSNHEKIGALSSTEITEIVQTCELKDIENLMKFNRKMAVNTFVEVDEKEIPIDIITYDKKMYFCVDIPKDIISSEKREELIALGPDYISGGLSNNVIFDYILAPFYWFLYKNDLLNNEKYCDLCKYTFGLH